LNREDIVAIEFDRNQFARIPLGTFAVAIALAIFAWSGPVFAQGTSSHPGAPIYKQAGCITCHKWHGMGGPGYGGTPINFRENFLTRDQLIEVIACGRPGTGMPYHIPQAYKDYECYEGMVLDDFEEEDRPGASRNVLSFRQVKSVAEFIIDHFEGRDDTLMKSDCQIFFGESRMCRKLKVETRGGGGGGH
jgi:cytochrome c551/c552